MFRLDVLQYQWLILALLGGLVLVMAMVLTYMAFWRQGDNEEATPGRRRAFLPWILIVTYVAIAIYAVVYFLYMVKRPPNW